MKINRKTLIGFEAFNDVEVKNIDVLDKKLVAKGLAMLNHFCRKGKKNTVKEVFEFWFHAENEQKDLYWDKINEFYKKNEIPIEKLILINLWSNFYFMNELLSYNDVNVETLSDIEFENVFFLNYLKINDAFVLQSNTIASKTKYDGVNIINYISKSLLVNSISNYEFTKVDPQNQIVSNFYKSFLLLNFLKSQYSDLYNCFITHYKVDNSHDYFKRILPIAFDALKAFLIEDKYGILKVENDNENQFLDRLIANKDIIPSNIEDDFKNLRANPLFKLSENEYVIIDLIFAINRIFTSIFWDIKLLNEKQKIIKKDWFGVYTYDFVEKYLCYRVFDKIYARRSYVRFSGDEIKSKFAVDTEPDYYIRNGKKIFIYEIKASIITGKTKQSFDIDLIEEELNKKFYFDKNDFKAVKQLIERIELIAKNDYKSCYDKNIPNNFTIVPILVFTDIAMNTPGVNYLLNKWFQEEIKKSQFLSGISIKPLVLVDINTLIVYSDVFLKDPKQYEKLLYDYCSFLDLSRIDDLKKKMYKDKQHASDALENYITARIISFSDFCGFKIGLPPLIAEFKKFGHELFRE